MRASNIFGGSILLLLGAIFLVDSLGIIEINIWGVLGPVMLILVGFWVLIGYFFRGDIAEGESESIPLNGIRNAKIRIHHGAGQLNIRPDPNTSALVSGTFGGGLKHKIIRDHDLAEVTLRIRDLGFPVFVPWFSGSSNRLNWDIGLNREIPIKLVLKTGASEMNIDLAGLQVTDLWVETGVSSTSIKLPADVPETLVVVKGGVASVKINIPENVAAKIQITGGLMDANVNRDRFPRTGGYYQSPDYDSASQKAEIKVNDGIGSVSIF
jgi:hypothetical protein